MQLIKTKASIPVKTDKRILVPTMGALHAGHLSLIELAKDYHAEIWCSIFVNPLQFGEGEDFEKYPKTLETDLEKLEGLGVDFVFAPDHQDLYATEPKQIKANSELANKLCGLSRPGHFDGVCTVVNLLFELIEPNYAVFGEKDYQQLKVIEEMVERLKLATEIIPAPIMRESSGLAMSSRNQYLTQEEKQQAANIYKLLQESTTKSVSAIESELLGLGIELEYLEKHWDRWFIAARLGQVRLIDNVVHSSQQ